MLVNRHISWRRRRSSTEVAFDTTVGHLDRADRVDIGAEAAERDAAWQLIADLAAERTNEVVPNTTYAGHAVQHDQDGSRFAADGGSTPSSRAIPA
jgi:hypothetical protein